MTGTGLACLVACALAGGEEPIRLVPARVPEVAPVPSPSATPVRVARLSDAGLVATAVLAGGRWLTFRVGLDRAVAIAREERVVVRSARREQVGGEILRSAGFRLSQRGPRELSWRVGRAQILSKEPLVPGERIRVTFVLAGLERSEIPFVVEREAAEARR